jgi:HAD superfamily hydrolase (TIGR01509 family)
MPNFRAVVFDMDGLMFNTEEVYTSVGSELMRRRGKTFSAGLKDAMMGLPPKESFEIMIRWHGLSDTVEQLMPESNAIFLELLRGQLALMPGLIELLAALEAAGIPKAIATSSSPQLTEACLTPFDFARRFQFVLTSEDIGRGKPDPEIYLAAAARFGVQPGEMLVLEDSQNGCRAASAAGAFTVAVPGEHSRRQDFGRASLVVASLADARLYAALGIPAAGALDPRKNPS